MDTKQPKVLRLANILRGIDTRSRFSNERLSSASDALENQHARITDLESQLAQRFDAADVATAAAQGFRDGVAYAALPRPYCYEFREPKERYTTEQMRAFADATHTLRVSHGEAPAQAASSAVLKAIREANMQLVRTGDDAFMLVPYKAVTAQAAESVTAPGGGVVAGRFMDEAAERRSAQEGYENRIKRVSERNPHDEGMYSLGWWDRAWKAAAPTPAAQAADSVQEDAARLERERICAAIKAEDDYCVDNGDYMLDSDDCIKIVRGEWVRPAFSADAARKQGASR